MVPLKRVLNAVQLVDAQSGMGAAALTAGRFGIIYTFSEGKKSCCVLIRRAPAPAPTLTPIYPHTHTHTLTDTQSYTQYGSKPYAKYLRDHMHIYIYQMQLMPTSRSRNVLVVSPRHVVSRICILLNVSSYIAGRRYPNHISFKSRSN